MSQLNSRSEQRNLQSNIDIFKAVFDENIDGIVVINKNNKITLCNKSSLALLGLGEEELVGKEINNLFSEQLIDFNDDSLSSFETVCMRSDRSHFTALVRIKKINFDECCYKVISVQDVSEKVHLEKLKDDFISSVNHELRTPLTSILGSVQIINKLYIDELGCRTREILNITEKSTRRIIKIVNDILDIQKIEAGQMSFYLFPTSVHDMLKKSADESLSYANIHHSSIEVIPCSEDLMINCDADRIVQVIINLLSNALKFSPKGEAVTLSTKINYEEQSIIIMVKDNGPGISNDFKNKLFDRFTQGDDILTRKSTGTGIGLNIAKLIVQKHGGEIGVKNRANGGAIFYFQLPLIKAVIPI